MASDATPNETSDRTIDPPSESFPFAAAGERLNFPEFDLCFLSPATSLNRDILSDSLFSFETRAALQQHERDVRRFGLDNSDRGGEDPDGYGSGFSPVRAREIGATPGRKIYRANTSCATNSSSSGDDFFDDPVRTLVLFSPPGQPKVETGGKTGCITVRAGTDRGGGWAVPVGSPSSDGGVRAPEVLAAALLADVGGPPTFFGGSVGGTTATSRPRRPSIPWSLAGASGCTGGHSPPRRSPNVSGCARHPSSQWNSPNISDCNARAFRSSPDSPSFETNDSRNDGGSSCGDIFPLSVSLIYDGDHHQTWTDDAEPFSLSEAEPFSLSESIVKEGCARIDLDVSMGSTDFLENSFPERPTDASPGELGGLLLSPINISGRPVSYMSRNTDSRLSTVSKRSDSLLSPKKKCAPLYL
mmetsp:Transcript_26808/g.53505  ORF Transcript_26808/g.53505 Transcript_26808/m.53505 type:complete len:415 (+) Transcript_26808:110-1354(+)